MKQNTIAQLSEQDLQYSGTNGFIRFAGVHLLIEMWGADHMDNVEKIEEIFRQAISDCGATLLHIHLHHFGEECGVTGVGLLSESHISIHTWPEFNYAALDLFLCGTKNPYEALPALKEGFMPERIQISEQKRGIFQ